MQTYDNKFNVYIIIFNMLQLYLVSKRMEGRVYMSNNELEKKEIILKVNIKYKKKHMQEVFTTFWFSDVNFLKKTLYTLTLTLAQQKIY